VGNDQEEAGGNFAILVSGFHEANITASRTTAEKAKELQTELDDQSGRRSGVGLDFIFGEDD
jgi:hypothetical protein